ncbi:MAG: hypothetical protein IPP19_09440 [Verrucomicrobia bacterium]|nr:hypothetical protein [Verrucomicrobiota bacterium]
MNSGDMPALSLAQPEHARCAREINALHTQVVERCRSCEKQLHGALIAAWQAGQLLREQKKHVLDLARGGWVPWLEQNFAASPRTAQRYMHLSRNVTDVSYLGTLSLRQAYMLLGLRAETKGRRERIPVPALPKYIRLSNRLLGAVPLPKEFSLLPAVQRDRMRQDLLPVWERLRAIFTSSSD